MGHTAPDSTVPPRSTRLPWSKLFRAARPGTPPQAFREAAIAILRRLPETLGFCVWQQAEGRWQPRFGEGLEQFGLAPGQLPPQLAQQIQGLIERPQFIAASLPPRPAGPSPVHCLAPIVVGPRVWGAIQILATPLATAEDPRSPWRRQLNRLVEAFTTYVDGADLKHQAEAATWHAQIIGELKRWLGAKTTTEWQAQCVESMRSLWGCDRVALIEQTEAGFTLAALSGQSTFDPKSQEAQRLMRLGERVATAQQLCRYEATPPAPPTAAAPTAPPAAGPPLENTAETAFRALFEEYPAERRPVWALGIPLLRPQADESKAAATAFFVVEQFRAEGPPPQALQGLAPVFEAAHATRQRWQERDAAQDWSQQWRKRLKSQSVIAGIIAGLLLAAWLIPQELRLPADGTLRARERQAIYAPEDGVVRNILVEHSQAVQAQQPLLVLENLELTARQREQEAQLRNNQEKVIHLEARRLEFNGTPREEIELEMELQAAKANVEHFTAVDTIYRQRLSQLQVTAPADGQLLSWNPSETLQNRPVRRGEALLELIQPNGAWHIECRLPETLVGYVLARQQTLPQGQAVEVELTPLTNPSERYRGKLRELSTRAEIYEGRPSVMAHLDLDPEHAPTLRDGAQVRLRVRCGPHSIGFVWFREVLELLQVYWMF